MCETPASFRKPGIQYDGRLFEGGWGILTFRFVNVRTLVIVSGELRGAIAFAKVMTDHFRPVF